VIESLALAASRNQVLAALLNNMEFRDETNSGLVYVELHSPDLWDDLIVAFSEVPIVPAATRALIEADPAAHIPAGIVVSGAYGVENHNPDRTLSLVRRDEYWARTVPLRAGSDNFVSLHFEYYRDGAARQQAMLAGGCDLYFDDSEVSQQRFKRSLPEQAEDKIAFLRALTTPVETVDALVFNTRAGALRDAKLRHALQVAVARRSPDLDGIFTANMLGTETVLDLIQQAAGADAKARWEAHKAAERKEPGEILREGGYRLTDGRLLAPSGQQVAITLVLPSWAHRMAFGDLFEELGVETRVEVLEPGDYWPAMRERAFDAAFFRYPPLSRYPTPEFLRLVYSPDGAYNLPLIEMAGAEALISMASQARTESEFVNVLSALDLLAMLEHPFVLFPAHAKDRVTARSNLNMPGDRDLPRWHELDFRFWWRNDT
jgi:ABC-type oligopeptide transport system substrate-binding subunit